MTLWCNCPVTALHCLPVALSYTQNRIGQAMRFIGLGASLWHQSVWWHNCFSHATMSTGNIFQNFSNDVSVIFRNSLIYSKIVNSKAINDDVHNT